MNSEFVHQIISYFTYNLIYLMAQRIKVFIRPKPLSKECKSEVIKR